LAAGKGGFCACGGLACGRLRDFEWSKSITVRGPGLANTVYRSL
jgi:hypothetical protein